MFIIFLFFSSLNALTLKQNQVRFIYEPFEEGPAVACQHQAVSETNPYDLKVICQNHEYTVHLMLNRYTHPNAPKMSYELLYWVNNEGATSWYHFTEATQLSSLESSQSVPGGVAGLRLKINLAN
jgi:hypothetical protein